ncbi:prepilin-type N-terminal cleavage/methylation domain-containing protein [Deltaproteobacteria bacterium]|nr:prepilin-type N-terminal cleavage/methylation domain-containing protein [Deltaproteobacteria bacterium]
MLITGNLNSHRERHNSLMRAGGFTLIELTMVILLFGLLLSLTVPRFQDAVITDHLKSASRKIISTTGELRNFAIREYKDYYLMFNLESNQFWIDSSFITEEERVTARENTFYIPEGVRIIDIWLRGEGKKTYGETGIRFTRKGYIQPSMIHLGSEDGRNFTLVLRPFLGKIEVMDSYVDFEDIVF